jgi:hypothetical protein
MSLEVDITAIKTLLEQEELTFKPATWGQRQKRQVLVNDNLKKEMAKYGARFPIGSDVVLRLVDSEGEPRSLIPKVGKIDFWFIGRDRMEREQMVFMDVAWNKESQVPNNPIWNSSLGANVFEYWLSTGELIITPPKVQEAGQPIFKAATPEQIAKRGNNPMLEPKWSPWGEVDGCTTITTGVYWVSTPSHGGLMIDNRIIGGLLTPEAIKEGSYFGDNERHWTTYEEDEQCNVAFYELQERGVSLIRIFGNVDTKDSRIKSLSRWRPDYLRSRGIEPDPKEVAQHDTMAEEDKMRKDKHPDLITAALRVEDNPDQTQVWTADGKKYIVTGYDRELRNSHIIWRGPRLSNVKIIKDLGMRESRINKVL